MKAKRKPRSNRVASNVKLERTRRGIAAYSHERKALLRLLRKRGSFSERDFDSWLRMREFRRPMKISPMTGDTFILGVGINGGNMWALWLDLLQQMMVLGEVDARTERGIIVYRLSTNT
jgi:hypothetical protein